MALSFTDMAVTSTDADTYATGRGKSSWLAATSADKATALRRGQDYIAGKYNLRFLTDFDNLSAPTQVQYAIFEAANLELATPGYLSPNFTMGQSKVLTGLDTLKWNPVTASPTQLQMLPTVSTIDHLLYGLVSVYYGAQVV